MAYFARRRAEGLTDRDIMRCLKRHVANEIYGALNNPATDNPVGRELRAQRQRIGVPITVLAATLGVPYQRLRRLEIGTRADPELEHRATLALAVATA
jgi:transposase